jgi:hypothetical protein
VTGMTGQALYVLRDAKIKPLVETFDPKCWISTA